MGVAALAPSVTRSSTCVISMILNMRDSIFQGTFSTICAQSVVKSNRKYTYILWFFKMIEFVKCWYFQGFQCTIYINENPWYAFELCLNEPFAQGRIIVLWPLPQARILFRATIISTRLDTYHVNWWIGKYERLTKMSIQRSVNQYLSSSRFTEHVERHNSTQI